MSILAVAQPFGSPGTSLLTNATVEVDMLRDLPGCAVKVLIGDEATSRSVADSLQEYRWAHFACHAVQSTIAPIDSALEMYDSHLTIGTMAQRGTENAEFAFLSACQSAKGSATIPNESIHIAAALQFVGFRIIVGTMWSVEDEDGPPVVRSFYSYLFKTNQSTPAVGDTAYALHHAVNQLRRNPAVIAARWVPFIHIGA